MGARGVDLRELSLDALQNLNIELQDAMEVAKRREVAREMSARSGAPEVAMAKQSPWREDGILLDNVEQFFDYQPWMPDQVEAGKVVRESLVAAAKAILRCVPPSSDRDRAIQHLRDARMDANSAITWRGRL